MADNQPDPAEVIALVVGSTWLGKSPREIANAVLSSLHSAGFLLVRDHTKET